VKALEAALAETEVPGLVDNLSGSVERLSKVLDTIIILSRLTVGDINPAIGPLVPAKVVTAAVSQIRDAAEARHILLVVPETGWPPLILADGALLEIALGNVLSNALKYTPDGGQITLSLAIIDGFLELTITDTGIGIDPEDQLLIFREFYTAGDTTLHSTSQTAYKGGGIGLGLAIARGIIEAHRGQIWVESSGRDEVRCPGSSFHILLPLFLETGGGSSMSADRSSRST
jgi:signal transduction histidine kinase